jgi:hypothetical protein
MDLAGEVEGGKVVLKAPRMANCSGVRRNYTVTLEGAVDTDAAGGRVLKLTGVDQACPLVACTLRDEYALTWMRAAPAPLPR